MPLPPEEIRRRIANMDRHLDYAYRNGMLVTTKYSLPITNRNRMLAYYAQRDEYARNVGVQELGPEEHDRRMAARKKGRQSAVQSVPVTALTIEEIKAKYGNSMPRPNRGGRWI